MQDLIYYYLDSSSLPNIFRLPWTNVRFFTCTKCWVRRCTCRSHCSENLSEHTPQLKFIFFPSVFVDASAPEQPSQRKSISFVGGYITLSSLFLRGRILVHIWHFFSNSAWWGKGVILSKLLHALTQKTNKLLIFFFFNEGIFRLHNLK